MWTRVISYATLKRENSIFHAAVSTDVEGGGGDGGGWFTHVCFEQVRLLQPYTILVSAIEPLTHDRALMNINYREREGERNPTGHGWGFGKEEETACNFFLMHSPKIFTSCGRPSLHWLVSRNNTLVV